MSGPVVGDPLSRWSWTVSNGVTAAPTRAATTTQEGLEEWGLKRYEKESCGRMEEASSCFIWDPFFRASGGNGIGWGFRNGGTERTGGRHPQFTTPVCLMLDGSSSLARFDFSLVLFFRCFRRRLISLSFRIRTATPVLGLGVAIGTQPAPWVASPRHQTGSARKTRARSRMRPLHDRPPPSRPPVRRGGARS